MRLNILDNPAFRLPTGVGPNALPAANPAVNTPLRDQQGTRAAVLPRATPAEAPLVGPGGAQAGNTTGGAQTLAAANRIEEGLLDPQTPPLTVAEANAEADQAQGLGQVAAPRLREFRFLTVAQSARERDLGNRQNQLERRLESVNNRLRYSNSQTIQTDARLERARLEQDLDMVSSQIRRMRLERVLATPAGRTDEVLPEQAAGTPTIPAASALPQPATPNQAPMLNLLA